MQKFAEGQETEVRGPLFGSIETDVDQEVPFQVSALPLLSTAAQKLAEGQETESSSPFGSIESGADQMSVLVADDTVIVTVPWAMVPCASVTVTPKLVLPVLVGVPEITPVEASRLSPAGREPEVIAQEYGVMPPVAWSVAEYALPTVAVGSDVVVILRVVGCPIARVSVAVSEGPSASESTTGMLTVVFFALAGGVPESTPVEERVSHVGRFAPDPRDQE
jgi:hypothetical protein